jgi:hypothetical protein
MGLFGGFLHVRVSHTICLLIRQKVEALGSATQLHQVAAEAA